MEWEEARVRVANSQIEQEELASELHNYMATWLGSKKNTARNSHLKKLNLLDKESDTRT